jgi:hypothetical protein
VVASDLGDSDVQDEEERRTPLARLQSNVVLSKSAQTIGLTGRSLVAFAEGCQP